MAWSPQGRGKEHATQPKEIPSIKPGMRSLIINWDVDDPQHKVQITGSISDIGQCYLAIEIAKDILREHNRLNCGYLKFDAPKPVQNPPEEK